MSSTFQDLSGSGVGPLNASLQVFQGVPGGGGTPFISNSDLRRQLAQANVLLADALKHIGAGSR